ncbi:MAG TPA: DoxX family protein [Patescibacteria group bacterium]|nr:DoxX family protein [Patescibacteria group bacterium]
MAIWRSLDPGWGVAVVRVVMGLILLTAGWGKITAGFATVAANFAKMGMPVPGVTGPFIALLELVGGALLLVGLGGRWLGLLFALEFVVATFVVKLPSAGWAGARLDVMLLAGGVLLFLAGSGRVSIDEVWLEPRPA